jgi:hypothetical protein
MRGNYETTHQDRIRFFHALLELCKPQVDSVDLVSTQLSTCNCADLLEELGYDQDSWETVGWEGEIWAKYTHANAPAIHLSADAYCGRLDISWVGVADGEDIDIDAFKEVLVEHWGKYFPVI